MPGPLYRDPWAAREAWRKSPIFSNKAMFRCVTHPINSHTEVQVWMTADSSRSMFPGLGTAIVAFTAYVIYDDFIAAKPKHDSHAAGHGH